MRQADGCHRYLFKDGDLTPFGLFLCGEAVVALALIAIGWGA